MEKFDEYLIKYSKYKWEFLRRNSAFIDARKKFEERLQLTDEKFHKWGGRILEAFRVKQNKYHRDRYFDSFLRTWNLSEPLDPDVSYDQYITELKAIRRLQKQEMQNMELTFNRLDDFINEIAFSFEELDPYAAMYFALHNPHTSTSAVGLVLEDEHIKRIDMENSVTISVNLLYPKNRIMKQFKAQLDYLKDAKSRHERLLLLYAFCKNRKIEQLPLEDIERLEFDKYYEEEIAKREKLYAERKHHFDNFDVYLKVYDLRQKGITWTQIANDLKLNNFQTARNHYKAACELIEQGIDLHVKYDD